VDGTVLLGLAGIGATLIVGLVGAGSVLIVANRQRQDSERHRFTDTKRFAYTDFLALLDEMTQRKLILAADFDLRYARATSQVFLVAPDEVRPALVSLLNSLARRLRTVDLPASEYEAAQEAYTKELAAFTNAARKDLGISE